MMLTALNSKIFPPKKFFKIPNI